MKLVACYHLVFRTKASALLRINLKRYSIHLNKLIYRLPSHTEVPAWALLFLLILLSCLVETSGWKARLAKGAPLFSRPVLKSRISRNRFLHCCPSRGAQHWLWMMLPSTAQLLSIFLKNG